jgi:hypothetical protein
VEPKPGRKQQLVAAAPKRARRTGTIRTERHPGSWASPGLGSRQLRTALPGGVVPLALGRAAEPIACPTEPLHPQLQSRAEPLHPLLHPFAQLLSEPLLAKPLLQPIPELFSEPLLESIPKLVAEPLFESVPELLSEPLLSEPLVWRFTFARPTAAVAPRVSGRRARRRPMTSPPSPAIMARR